jgi:anti-sigma factor RsiW
MIGRCLSPGEMLALAEDSPASEPRSQLEDHAAKCPECARALAGIREAVRELRRAATPPMAEAEECPDWELVAAYADGSASGEDATRAESHLAGCSRCLAFAADLWSARDRVAVGTEDSTFEKVLDSLVSRARTAIVRWTGSAFSVVRGFASGLDEGEASLAPAWLAGAARGGPRVRFGWEGEKGVKLECEVRLLGDHPALAGRVTAGDDAARELSVALRGGAEIRGPESLDALGRFGPWPLARGRNELVLSGARLTAGRVELAIELEGAGA